MPVAYINLNNLRANYLQLSQMAGDKKIIAVIKANAYGHGLCEVASALPQAHAFAVARIEDAILLRQHAIMQRIIVLTGVYTASDLALAAENNIDLVVHSEHHLNWLQAYTTEHKFDIWLKVDTGMHRLGFRPNDVPAAVAKLRSCKQVANIRLLSHFASADDINNPSNAMQIEEFSNLPALEKSFANSAAFVNYPDLDSDWPRIGLLMYGVLANKQLAARVSGLKPVMSLRAPVIAIKRLLQGEQIGYNGTYICPKDMTVAVVGIGYGDGYPREVSDAAYCVINDKRCPLVGRVSMDMLSVDVSSVDDISLGVEAEMWGAKLPVSEVAIWAETIAYTLISGLTASVNHCITD